MIKEPILYDLPDETLKTLLYYLSPIDVLILASTCKRFQQITNEYIVNKIGNCDRNAKSIFVKKFSKVYKGSVKVSLCTSQPSAVRKTLAAIDSVNGAVLSVNRHFPMYGSLNYLNYTCEMSLKRGTYKVYWKIRFTDPNISLNFTVLINNDQMLLSRKLQESASLVNMWITFVIKPIELEHYSTVRFELKSSNYPWWLGQLYCDYLCAIQTMNSKDQCQIERLKESY